ncbi:MAG: ATP-binding protein, partial [Planctomycetota bacterium]
MIDQDRWQEQNQQYLTAAVKWVRLKLMRLVYEHAPRAGAERRGCLFFWRKPVSKPSPKRVSEKETRRAGKEAADAEQYDPPPAMIILSRHLGLSRFERQVLLLCVAMEMDTRIAPLCAAVQDHSAQDCPTFALAMALFDDPAWDALSPEGPLRHWRLVEISQPGAQPLTTSALRADERIVSYVRGFNYLDDRLTPPLLPFDVSSGPAQLPASHLVVTETVVGRLSQSTAGRRPPIVQLVGIDRLSKQMVAVQ